MQAVVALLLWVLAAYSMVSPARAAEPTLLPDANGCRVYDPSPLPGETVTWSGACKDGLADGPGKVQWISDGKVSGSEEGTYKDGKLNGHGVIHYSGGEVYEGELVDGVRQGHGIFTDKNGIRKEGDFNHGALALSSAMKVWYANLNDQLFYVLDQSKAPARDGTVVITTHLDAAKKVTSWQIKTSSGFEDLDAYVLDGANRIAALPVVPTDNDIINFSYQHASGWQTVAKPDPPVTLVSDANGCQAESPRPSPGTTITWTGACKDKFLDGPGVLSWPDAKNGAYSIEATFSHGAAQGPAVVSYPDKRRYEGELKHNSVTGVGTLSDPEGNRYQGDLFEGKFQGQGKIVYADHSSYAGGWYQDMRVGAGDAVDSDGGQFQGMYLNNVRMGYGILDPRGRVRYAGRFVNNRPAGPVSYASHYAGPEPSMVEYKPVNLQVESYKTYRQLSPDEKARVDAQYPTLAKGDEPPYPAHGLLPIYHELLRLESLYLFSGVYSIVVHVDKTGRPSKVDVVSAPDDDLARQATEFVLRQQFKPALCGQAACEMTFPLAVSLTH